MFTDYTVNCRAILKFFHLKENTILVISCLYCKIFLSQPTTEINNEKIIYFHLQQTKDKHCLGIY